MNHINTLSFIITLLLHNNTSIVKISLCISANDKVFQSALFSIKPPSHEFDSF